MNTTEMKRYRSAEWNFALDIPKRWHAFPPVSSNSPAEVIRFASKEEGNKDGMFDLYDRMARSFEFSAE
jgi:hypothetical protein